MGGRRVGLLSYIHRQAAAEEQSRTCNAVTRASASAGRQDAGSSSPAFKRSAGRGHGLELPSCNYSPRETPTLQFTFAKEMK